MNDYIELRVVPSKCDETITDILAAILADAGYESFVPDRNGLTAYIKSELFDPKSVENLLISFPIEGIKFDSAYKTIIGQDWNEEWEKNYFQPIVIGDKCVIHSTFHHDYPKCDLDIVIDPKMAFGTGHHQTTSLIIARLIDSNLKGKSLIDVGTGTGILSIVAAMLGAAEINAIEIDEFAYVNAVENVRLNGHPEISVLHGDASLLAGLKPADYLVANINRNIIIQDVGAYASVLNASGTAIFSGFYSEDIPAITDAALQAGLSFIDFTQKDNWVSAMFKKS